MTTQINMNDNLLEIINNFDSSGNDYIIGNRNKIKTFDYNGNLINVKSFQVPMFINGLIYKFIRKSKAERSFINASLLISKNIGTPKPIAFYEKFSGLLLKESYYFSEHLLPDYVFKDIFYPNKKNISELDIEIILRGVARFTFNLHENGIEFLDHSPGNTLIKKNINGNFDYFLVDLNRMVFHKKMTFDIRMKNLCRLTPSKEMIKIISNEYAKISGESEILIFESIWKKTSDFQFKFQRKQRLKNKLKFWKK